MLRGLEATRFLRTRKRAATARWQFQPDPFKMRSHGGKTHLLLLREADATKQVSEARVASQRIESGIHPDKGHSIRTSQISLLEPSKGLLAITQGGINTSHIESADVALAGLCLYPAEHRASNVLLTRHSVGGG